MTNLLVLKEYIKFFYGKYEIYIQPLGKFLLSFICLSLINGELGYMSTIDNTAIVLIAALMCSFLPKSCMILVSALFILLHLYEMSLECAIVALAAFLVMFLLYFRLSPKDTMAVLLTPVCFALKIPYVIPVAVGLSGTPAGAVSVGCGVMIYYLIEFMSANATAIGGMGAEETMTRFRFAVDGLLGNKAMFLTIIAFAFTIIVVYLIRRLSIDRSWSIASITGALVDVIVLLVGDLIYDTNISILGLIVGAVLAVVVGEAVRFFLFNVDYNRVEKVQFEDDEYYYYVKAVPKISVSTPTKNVKKINSQRKAHNRTSSVSKSSKTSEK